MKRLIPSYSGKNGVSGYSEDNDNKSPMIQ